MKRAMFFDMDGVLSNFVNGALKVHGHHAPNLTHGIVEWGLETQLGLTPEVFWRDFGYEFWANLEPYDDGFRLLRAAEGVIGAERIGILTSPCETAGCIDGKREWVAKHLPDYKRRLFVGSAKELFASEGKILIDDHEPNVQKFKDACGCAILVPRPWNSRKSEVCPLGMFDVERIVAVLP